MLLDFEKYQGTGNDFVITDHRSGVRSLSPEEVRRLCDRHRGIGADGVLAVWPHAQAHARMRVHNADGSESGMCGNGLRCVARYLFENDPQLLTAARLTLAAGEQVYDLEHSGQGRFRVAMGAPTWQHSDLPPLTIAGARYTTLQLRSGRVLEGIAVHFGNPHFVALDQVEDGASDDLMRRAEQLGPEVERHPAFPRRTNASFVEKLDETRFRAVVYERGCGITQACGSGACAIGVALVEAGLAPRNRALSILLPGGELMITVQDAQVVMEGAARHVFAGQIRL